MDELERKKKLYSSAAVIASAITLGCLQQGKLGGGIFAIQLTITLISCSWIPYLYHIDYVAKLSNLVCITFGGIWIATCFGPVFVELVIELFTGHRRPGSTFIDAIWRIYAILGVWIGFALLMERIIRPYWKKHSDKFLSGIRKYSVANDARRIAIEKRSKALDGIKARMKHHEEKKKNAIETIESKKKDIEKERENVEKARNMLEKEESKLETCDQDDKDNVKEMVKTMQDLLKSSLEHEAGLRKDITRLQKDIEHTNVDLDQIKQEYREALHINNYTGFYR